VMRGRELWSIQESPEECAIPCNLADALRQRRGRMSLRCRLKERGAALHTGRRELERGVATQDGLRIGAALAVADPDSAARTAIDWQRQGTALALWVGRLWEAEDPYETLESFWRSDPIPGACSWLPAAVLHLRDARSFQPWNEPIRQSYALL